MRCADIQIHVKIPVPTNSDGDNIDRMPCFRDGNGVVYQIEAVKDACEEMDQWLPIIRYKDNGRAETIGVARSVKWNPEGFIEVDGVLRFGGTSEEIIFDTVKNVTSMTIEAIGIGT